MRRRVRGRKVKQPNTSSNKLKLPHQRQCANKGFDLKQYKRSMRRTHSSSTLFEHATWYYSCIDFLCLEFVSTPSIGQCSDTSRRLSSDELSFGLGSSIIKTGGFITGRYISEQSFVSSVVLDHDIAVVETTIPSTLIWSIALISKAAPLLNEILMGSRHSLFEIVVSRCFIPYHSLEHDA